LNRLIITAAEKEGKIEKMIQGQVKWFSDKKGFGFINCEKGDVFVHHSNIQMSGFKTLSEGDQVTFEIEPSDKGLTAKNVTKQ
jgi:CspA family cold shock protein